jgi:hypothetical protein
MNLRTTFTIDPSPVKISYNTPVMFIGSCFASEIGSMLREGKISVMINPSGAVYNPVSVSNTIDNIIKKKEFNVEELYNNNGTYLSFYHSTDFSSDEPEKTLEKINNKTKEAQEFISKADFLFITFGTARVYRWKKTGIIVSNCHKIHSDYFDRELLSVNEIATLWRNQLDQLHLLFPHLKIVFTISPVRHWKDGAHGNQISKSVLFLALEELLKHPAVYGYFPAYELVMDDLRDYRYYADDMLHPSGITIEYIWKAFSECYFQPGTLNLWNEVRSVTKARNHRLLSDSQAAKTEFANTILNQISQLEKKIKGIDLGEEQKYFLGLLSQ